MPARAQRRGEEPISHSNKTTKGDPGGGRARGRQRRRTEETVAADSPGNMRAYPYPAVAPGWPSYEIRPMELTSENTSRTADEVKNSACGGSVDEHGSPAADQMIGNDGRRDGASLAGT